MKSLDTRTSLLSIALCLALAGPASAATPAAATDASRQKELAQAQAELARAASRVAELSRELGRPALPALHVEQRIARKPVIGVVLAPDPVAGVRIVGVTPESAAAAAGLRSGDRLVAVDGTPILGSDEMLRVANARKLLGKLDTSTPVALGYVRGKDKATVKVTPKLGGRVFAWTGDAPVPMGDFAIETPPGMDRRIRAELARVGECGDGDCRLPALAEAFRWNGLNLASVDPQLGRYFGTDSGVLVLSAGRELKGLQPGDVIRKVDGKTVASPRQAMEAMRARPAGSTVAIDYLRDRKPASTRIAVPKPMPLLVPPPPPPPAPAPPAPPAPPPPKAASLHGGVPAPAPPAAPMIERRIVVVDGEAPLPPPPPDGDLVD